MSIAMLLSGGVDSSVALALLKRRGHDSITAFYLKIWLEDDVRFLGNCPWEEDLAEARVVCDRLGVRLEVVSLQREYFERVVTYALSELRAGRTPSPDIFCNQRIKFGLFGDRIGPEFERIASGHYAVIRHSGGIKLLARSPDRVKDQTYFLSHQRSEQIAKSLFPIGHLEKRQVRRLAGSFALPNASRPDSQGICFLGKIRYPDFVAHYLGERHGDIVEERSGRILGPHRGYWFYTIGQRQGLGLGNGPWYVSGKSVEENVVYVTHGNDDASRMRSSFTVTNPHWINDPPADGRLEAKIRHGPAICGCMIAKLSDGRYSVELDKPDGGIAPGQFTVFYDGDVCLGGALIE